MKVGQTQTLTVRRISDYGLYLVDEEQNEVLLPNRYVSLENKEGDTIDVFVYHDSENRMVASTETPLIRDGEVAFLMVVDKNDHGAFLDWGLAAKHLFLPNRNQIGGVVVGQRVPVYLYIDDQTNRCVASMHLKELASNDFITVKERQPVELLVISQSPIGFRTIIDHKHWGMLYKNQLFRPVQVGDKLTGYVRRITEDNRIDVSLQQAGVAQVRDSSQILLELMQANGGMLPLNDDSSPEQIAVQTQMSKKTFKRSLGMLLKAGQVEFFDRGVRIVPPKTSK